MVITFAAVIGAIASGCCAVIKPSEIVPHFSQLMADILPKYLDSSAYRIVNGAIPEASKLLELQWDSINYTGNSRVGRIVASAAAKHLTPCSLELGGKSPVYVDSAYDMDLAAKRILHGKCRNAGQVSHTSTWTRRPSPVYRQICVAPDYILVSRQKQDELIQGLEKVYKGFFPDGALGDTKYSNIVNDIHFRRLTNLLERSKGEKVIEGRRDAEKRRFELVVVKDVKADDSLLEEYVITICTRESNNFQSVISGRYLDPYCPSLPWMVWMKQSTS